MVTVITYGTFDLFHEGHHRLLERAKALGDLLIVGVTTENYDESRGKLNVSQTLVERIENVRRSGLADEIIVEEYEGQKIDDIQRLGVDIFAIGSDWVGKFDYLKEYCLVVYLERTKGVSSTQLRNDTEGITRFGIVGTGRIAKRFVVEARYVSGVNVESVYSILPDEAASFADHYELSGVAASYQDMLGKVDAVYVATPHQTHYEYAKQALDAGVHVLCEKPMTLVAEQALDLVQRAEASGTVLLEAVKTAFLPGFQRLIAVTASGVIGKVRSVNATFTKLVESGREYDPEAGGSISELATYPLLAVIKLLGPHPTDVRVTSLIPGESPVEVFSRIDLQYPHGIATATTGIGVKSEGELVIAGSKGYIYVPAPWWLTEYFETRFDDQSQNKKYYHSFDGDGLRYELAEFTRMIRSGTRESFRLKPSESIALATIIEQARCGAATIIV